MAANTSATKAAQALVLMEQTVTGVRLMARTVGRESRYMLPPGGCLVWRRYLVLLVPSMILGADER